MHGTATPAYFWQGTGSYHLDDIGRCFHSNKSVIDVTTSQKSALGRTIEDFLHLQVTFRSHISGLVTVNDNSFGWEDIAGHERPMLKRLIVCKATYMAGFIG